MDLIERCGSFSRLGELIGSKWGYIHSNFQVVFIFLDSLNIISQNLSTSLSNLCCYDFKCLNFQAGSLVEYRKGSEPTAASSTTDSFAS